MVSYPPRHESTILECIVFVISSGCACWKWFESVYPVLSYCLMFLFLLSVFNSFLYYQALWPFLLSRARRSGKSTKPHSTLIFILYVFCATILFTKNKSQSLHSTPFFFSLSLSIRSRISIMFWPEVLTIFWESYAVMFQLKLCHVVTTVVCTIIKIGL
jgi:hypothetical protein